MSDGAVKMVECPQCHGRGRVFDTNLIGGLATTCGVCSGRCVVSEDKREEYLDRLPVTRGEVKRMIQDAIRRAMVGVQRISRWHRPRG